MLYTKDRDTFVYKMNLCKCACTNNLVSCVCINFFSIAINIWRSYAM